MTTMTKEPLPVAVFEPLWCKYVMSLEPAQRKRLLAEELTFHDRVHKREMGFSDLTALLVRAEVTAVR